MNENLIDRRAYPEGLRLSRWRTADGWDHRRFDWPADDAKPARGSMIFQAGRGDYFEKYIETLDEWHRAGWNLRGFDWRGQAGSGRFLTDPTVGHVESFDIWIEDFTLFLDAWLAETPGPHVVVAHSMGGHLVLRQLIEQRSAVDAVVLSAPMLEVSGRPLGQRLGRLLARLCARIGWGDQHAWQENERPSLPGSSRQRLLTHCQDRYADEMDWIEQIPGIRIGPPSWQWLVAAFASSAKLFAPGLLERFDKPVLLIGAAQDRLVNPDAIRRAAARLPDAQLHMDRLSLHEVFREIDEIRTPIMKTIRRFLDEKAPAPR
ncbi:MAG: alpha/beta hydrolase [Sphingomonadaceae bacterium]|nr:alpha/beta hydrolase [Sphingomonadaceae bacterium]